VPFNRAACRPRCWSRPLSHRPRLRRFRQTLPSGRPAWALRPQGVTGVTHDWEIPDSLLPLDAVTPISVPTEFKIDIDLTVHRTDVPSEKRGERVRRVKAMASGSDVTTCATCAAAVGSVRLGGILDRHPEPLGSDPGTDWRLGHQPHLVPPSCAVAGAPAYPRHGRCVSDQIAAE
jgi:hypothetical protein